MNGLRYELSTLGLLKNLTIKIEESILEVKGEEKPKIKKIKENISQKSIHY